MSALHIQDNIGLLRTALAEVDFIQLAVLVGSRVSGTATEASDWDIAVRLFPSGDSMHDLDCLETVRRISAASLGITETAIDLIEMSRLRLAMRALIAEEGVPLKGDDTLAWSHFLQRTWRELEEYYWERTHAA